MVYLTDTAATQGRALPRVLIADPSAVVIERLVSSIDDVARVVGRATTARDAINGIRLGNPHLAVFDIAIGNGIELLKQIKSHQPPVVTVVLTHSVEETTRRTCLRLGADYFLDKIREVKPEDVKTVANKYMKNIRFVVIGNPSAINKQIFVPTQNQ